MEEAPEEGNVDRTVVTGTVTVEVVAPEVAETPVAVADPRLTVKAPMPMGPPAVAATPVMPDMMMMMAQMLEQQRLANEAMAKMMQDQLAAQQAASDARIAELEAKMNQAVAKSRSVDSDSSGKRKPKEKKEKKDRSGSGSVPPPPVSKQRTASGDKELPKVTLTTGQEIPPVVTAKAPLHRYPQVWMLIALKHHHSHRHVGRTTKLKIAILLLVIREHFQK